MTPSKVVRILHKIMYCQRKKIENYILSKIKDAPQQDYVLSKEEVKAEMDKLIKSKAVFVVGKSYCPYTKKAKQVLKYGKKYEPI